MIILVVPLYPTVLDANCCHGEYNPKRILRNSLNDCGCDTCLHYPTMKEYYILNACTCPMFLCKPSNAKKKGVTPNILRQSTSAPFSNKNSTISFKKS